MTAMPIKFDEQRNGTSHRRGQQSRRAGKDQGAKNRVEADRVETDLGQEEAREAQQNQARSGPDDSYLRLMADFENYKRHAERRIGQAQEEGADELVRKLAPVIADLEKAIRAKGPDVESMRQGVEMVAKKLQSVLESMGYERIATRGHELDPSVHEAVAQIPAPGQEPGLIVAETNPGFTRKGKLVLPAKVVVAGPASETSDAVRRR